MTAFIRTFLGHLIFWASWPFLYLYLRGTKRTRVIIEAEGSILMLRGWQDGSNWAFPGGGVQKNESPVESAIREVAEETSISISSENLIDLGEDMLNERGLEFSLLRYGCKLQSKPSTTKQHLEVIALEWLKLAEISENMVDKATWRHLQSWKQHR